ncbi:ropporin-1-like protein isoform X3 [Anabas testudineus]|uniref:ropporin-1-like protein isoform X3 n=1 Tax=Anabas testudineus TaxID=64144 RepID=UPI000E4572EE|nr:ropporin-1-like protein isoform X3 [Anabas testudineus]
MPLPDTMYCSQQINIPPELPDILKTFTKAAIRTQPKDLWLWSAAYFSALSKGECLPVKDRLEMNVATQKTDTGLTPGLLKTLHKQTLMSSLKIACEILTEDEEGGAARIPFSTFVKLYTFLAHLDGDMPQDHIDNFLSSLQPLVELQHGMIKPLDFIYREDMDSTPSSFSKATSRAE